MNNGNSRANTTDNKPEWLKIVDDLIKLEGEIESISKQKAKDALCRAIHRFQEVDAATQTNCEIITTIEKGFQKLEEKLSTKLEGSKGPAKVTTWASVAAAAAVPHPTTASQSRPTVRIRVPEAADKPAAELLARVKPMIPGAYAVRPLRSGDIEVVVPDQRTKDQVLNQRSVEGCKVLRQDYRQVCLFRLPLKTERIPKTKASLERFAGQTKECCLVWPLTGFDGFTMTRLKRQEERVGKQGEQSS